MSELSALRIKWQPARHVLPVVAAASLGLAVAVAAWFAVSAWEQRLAKAKFAAVAGDYAAVLQNGLDDYLGKLRAVRAFYDASHRVDRREFNLFTSQILAGYDDAMRLVWCPRVTREERAAFEREAREGGLPGFVIKTWAPSASLQISPERDEYFPVLYSTVASKQTATFGVDLNSEATRSEAISRARDGDTIATAQNVTIRNAIGGVKNGFFAVIPTYRQDVPHSTVEERRRNTLGMIIGAFQTQAIFDSILRHAKLPQEADLYLYPKESGPETLPVFVHGPHEPKPKGGLGRAYVMVGADQCG